MDGENNGKPMKTLLKWMIWGYHYFWKHPYIYVYIYIKFDEIYVINISLRPTIWRSDFYLIRSYVLAGTLFADTWLICVMVFM